MKKIHEDSVGFRIRLARQNANMSQNELAGWMQIGANYLGRVERGNAKPSERLLLKVVQRCHVPYDWLLYGESADLSISSAIDKTAQDMIDDIAVIIQSSSQDRLERLNVSSYHSVTWKPDLYLSFIDRTPYDDINNWAFDLSACITPRYPYLNVSPQQAVKYQYNDFMARILFTAQMICAFTKFTFVVPNDDCYNQLLEKPNFYIGNISIIQVDLKYKKLVREHNVCLFLYAGDDSSSEDFDIPPFDDDMQ